MFVSIVGYVLLLFAAWWSFYYVLVEYKSVRRLREEDPIRARRYMVLDIYPLFIYPVVFVLVLGADLLIEGAISPLLAFAVMLVIGPIVYNLVYGYVIRNAFRKGWIPVLKNYKVVPDDQILVIVEGDISLKMYRAGQEYFALQKGVEYKLLKEGDHLQAIDDNTGRRILIQNNRGRVAWDEIPGPAPEPDLAPAGA